jgi:hypothetical protein
MEPCMIWTAAATSLRALKNEVRGEVIKFGVKGRVADFQPDALRRLGGTR